MSRRMQNKGQRCFNVFNIALLLALTICTLCPLLHVVFASFSDDSALQAHQGLLLRPMGFTVEAYKMVLKDSMILTGYLNTMFVLICGLAINMTLTILGAFVLSRQSFIYRNRIMLFIVFTMYFSGGMVPTYLLVRKLGLIDSLWAVILPTAMSSFNLIILRTNFMQVPVSLEESVKLDGGGHWTVLFRIVLPLSKAGLAVIFLYYAVTHWNSWFNASLYIQDRSKYPLQLVLRDILIVNDVNSMTYGDTGNNVSEALKYAVIVIVTLPILVIYPFIQKYFTQGVMIGAVKG